MPKKTIDRSPKTDSDDIEKRAPVPAGETSPLRGQKRNSFFAIESIFLFILIAIIAASSWGIVSHIKARAETDIGKSLKAELESSYVGIQKQLLGHKNSAIIWSKNNQVKTAIKKLIALPIDPDTLINNDAQRSLRELITSLFETVGYHGYFVIGANNINLASSRDNNIGAVNLLINQGNFLDRVRAGETLVSLPQPSDVALKDISGKLVERLSTMFVATPIENNNGNVIAILAFRLDPDESFSQFFISGRFGKSGETYAFNKDGILISESRFNEQLLNMGLIEEVDHSDLNLDIRDPGVNLVIGQTPSLPRDKQPLTQMAKSAVKGESGMDLNGYRDYRGVPVAGTWLWDNEHKFGIATEINIEEAFSAFYDVRIVIYIFSAISIGVLIILAVVSSITRQRLSQSEKKYRNSIDSTAEGYWLVDIEGRVLEVNNAFCEMLGRSSEEIVGTRPPKFATNESRALHEQRTSEITTSDQRRYEVTFNKKQGGIVYTDINATTIRDENGTATGAFAFINDVTVRKETERELDFQKFALDEHAIVSIADIKGNITYINEKFCKISGYSRDELIGQNHRMLKSGDHTDEFYSDLWQTIANGKVWHGHIKNNRKGGGSYWVDATIVPSLNEKGKPFQYVAIRSDITALKESEEVIRDSEKRFRSVVENAGDAIYIHDRYGKIYNVNLLACEQTGYTYDELLEMSVAQLDAAIDFENLKETWDLGEADPSKFPMTLETAHRRKDGTTFPIEVRISLLPSEDNAQPRLIAMVRDITERKEFDKALAKSEERFRNFTETASDWVWETDSDLKFTYVSERFFEVANVDKSKIIGKTRWDYVGPKIIALAPDAWQKHREDFENHRLFRGFQYPVETEPGEFRYISLSGIPVFDEDGKFNGYRGTGADVSERVLAQEKVRESEERLINAIENVADGFVLFDENDRLLICNKQYRHLYPNSIDLIIPGAKFEDIVRGGAERGEYHDAEGRVEEWVAERLKLREASDIFEQHLIGDRWIRVYDKKLPNGMTVGARVDITELKTTQKKLQKSSEEMQVHIADIDESRRNYELQAQAMAELAEEQSELKGIADKANQAKSDFLSSMSHELRTPMNAILGFGQMLDFNPKEPLTPAQKACVDHIMKGGKHLLDLINDILDLARIEAGKVELSIEDISPMTIIDECVPLIKAMAEKRGIDLSFPDESIDVPNVRADHTRFKQVLLNFMSNAVKYNRENGSVSVNFEQIDNNMLRINVTDTGDGIMEEKQTELFKPFSRLGAENTDVEGTGIGLVVCKDLVETMNGSVGLESEVGTGSTFWFTLPTAEHLSEEVVNQIHEAVAQLEKNLPNISGKLLYVEDNPANLQLMELIIQRIEGLSLISAHTGELGIEMARSEKPDVIILDINLPGMNGMEVLKKLQNYEEAKNIPTLALSAAATTSDIKKGIDAGFLQYLTKPIQVPVVVEAIKTAMERSDD